MKKWLSRNTGSLSGKTVAVTGTTGGIGRELCRYLAKLGARLILCDRNKEKSHSFAEELRLEFGINAECVTVDLSLSDSVKAATQALAARGVDVFIHNAGAYSIPRYITAAGLDNVYEINFAAPYYMIRELLPALRQRAGRVVVVGSIAHNYSKADFDDADFHTRHAASKVYGNAKRWLMASLYELFKNEERVTLSVTHPGIAFTNITAHYPKLIFAVIRHPMKIIFMKPKKAALSVLLGVFVSTDYHEWIGPRIFDVWGLPKKKKLRTVSEAESLRIGKTAEEIYNSYKRMGNL